MNLVTTGQVMGCIGTVPREHFVIKMSPPMTTATDLPWDTSVGNRLVRCFSENHRAPLSIAALLALMYSLGILFIKIHIKWRVVGWDDYLIPVSTVNTEH
jgi:hypothetical protein